MSSKKIISVVAIIMVAFMLFAVSGCAAPAAATGQEAPAAAAGADAKSEPVAATNQEAPAAAPDAAGYKPFKDVKIVFFPGGGEGDVFATTVYNGAKQAAEDLGCKVEYVWSDWDPNQMINQLKEAIARTPDGIAIMGHPGDDAYKSIVDEAEKKGIIITSQNTPLPELESAYKTSGFGYAGAELYPAGATLAQEAAKRSGIKSGDRAMVWGLMSQPGRGERTKGCVDALEEMGVTVDYIEISDAVNADPTQGTPIITSYLASNPDCKMVITDHGSLTSTLGTYLKASGKKPGEIFGAGFDLSGDTSAAITEGWVGAVLDQQQWLQGYLPILQLCLAKTYGFSGLHIDTGAAIIDAQNIEFVKPLAEKGIR